MTLILGLESSCDDTGIALYDLKAKKLSVHLLASQATIHESWGGVVPELAARNHIQTMAPLIQQALNQAACGVHDLSAVAYTAGPGLAGSLMVGAAVANGLASTLNIPALGLHHMEAHLMAAMLEENRPEFPFITLLVSGGHTLLLDTLKAGHYRILGTTLDDAVGEAFDKTAKLLGLGYPGGPCIEKHALKGDPEHFSLPRPMLKSNDLNFSFSGLKTAVRRVVEKIDVLDAHTREHLCASFQKAAIDTLVAKCRKALSAQKRNRLVVAGGVGANQYLRLQLRQELADPIQLFYPRAEFCVDNGAMVAYLGAQRFNAQRQHLSESRYSFSVKPRWSLESLQPFSQID